MTSIETIKELLARATKGPWVQFLDEESRCVDIKPAMRPGTIALVTELCDETDANAALIALAPELAQRLIDAEARIVAKGAEAYITDAGLGLSDVLSQWLGEAEREIATAHDHAMVHEMRRIQSVNSRGAE